MYAYPAGFAVVEAGIGPPRDSLVVWEISRSLSLEEQNAFGQRLTVVMASQSTRNGQNQQQCQRNQLRHFLRAYTMCVVPLVCVCVCVFICVYVYQWMFISSKYFLINPPNEI